MSAPPSLDAVLARWLDRDLSAALEQGALGRAFERELELERLEEVLAAGRSPILVGESGVGKTALVHELLMRARDLGWPACLVGRRVLQLSIRRCASTLKQGESVGERMMELAAALAREGRDVVPFFRDFPLAWSFDLEPHFESLSRDLCGPIICEGERSVVDAILEQEPGLENRFVVVPVSEPPFERARAIVETWAWHEGSRVDLPPVGFEPRALETALQLGHRFLVRGRLPRKVIEPLVQLAGLKRGEGGSGRVTEDDVIDRFCNNYSLPRLLVDARIPLDLDQLERGFRSDLLGQDVAVAAMMNMIARIKAGLVDPRRPFGVFLFVGPTGVGKTHLARLLAQHLFGSSERMIRLNMADHPEDKDAGVLFGSPDAHRPADKRGLVTQRVLGQPFAVLLLDEFEKASAKVHDRFLQLFDEGSFQNGAGEMIACRSLIVIATSNAGAELWREDPLGFPAHAGQRDVASEVDRELQRHFRFEFLNRFDQVVHFHPLSRREIRTLAMREVDQLRERAGMRSSGLELDVDEGVLDWLTVHGYDPYHGARFLRRTIERNVASALAEVLVRERPRAGEHIALTVRANRVTARLSREPAAAPARREVLLPVGTEARARQLDRESLLAESRGLLSRAEPRLTALEARRRESSRLLEEMNAPDFWERGDHGRELLDRYRELDVCNRVEGRLAHPLERLRVLVEDPRSELSDLAHALEHASRVVREWDERRAEDFAGALWLTVHAVDPLEKAGEWVADVVLLELAWCKKLQLAPSLVAVCEVDGELRGAALEVQGPGATGYLEMERGLHRLRLPRARDRRARVELFAQGVGAEHPVAPVRTLSPRAGPLNLELAALVRAEHEELGLAYDYRGPDVADLLRFAADWSAHLGTRGVEEPPVARLYGEDGIGARDPRTGATVPRFKDALRGRLDRLLEAWLRAREEPETAATGEA